MKTSRLPFTIACLGALAVLGIAGPSASSAAEETRDGVLIHLTKDGQDPHRVLMALRMAEIMAEDHPVLIYLDIDAVRVALDGAPDVSFKEFPSSRAQLARLIEKGVEIHVCPGCLKAAGKSPSDLMAGVKIAQKERFFAFTRGRVITLDY
jgi:predicted peroxiredoxin